MADNGFGYNVPKEKSFDFSAKHSAPSFMVEDYDVKLVADEKGNITGDSVAYVKGKHDLYQDIQSQKDSCGLSYILKEIANGRVNPSSLVDDVRINGDQGGDFTRPTMRSQAYPLMVQDAENSKKLAKFASELGVSVQDLINCKDISGLIAEKLSTKAAPSSDAASDSVPGGNQ